MSLKNTAVQNRENRNFLEACRKKLKKFNSKLTSGHVSANWRVGNDTVVNARVSLGRNVVFGGEKWSGNERGQKPAEE